MKDKSSVSKRFQDSMDELGITGYQMERDGVIKNAVTISNIKSGSQNPSIKMLRKYCEKYNADFGYIMTGIKNQIRFDTTGIKQNAAYELAKKFFVGGDLDEISYRFLHAAKELGKKSTDLFKDGVISSTSIISSIKNGRQLPSEKTIDTFCEKYGVNKYWIYTGDGDMMDSEENSNTSIIKSENSGIPYFNVDFEMGYDEMFNDQTSNPEFLIDFKPYNKCDVWCNARGNSMYPTIASGDIIALKEIKDTRYIISNEIYAIVTENGLRTIKRIIDKGDRYTLVPDNKEYPEQDIDKSVVTKLFLVVGAMKMF